MFEVCNCIIIQIPRLSICTIPPFWCTSRTSGPGEGNVAKLLRLLCSSNLTFKSAADTAGHVVIIKLESFLNPLPGVKELLITWNDTVVMVALWLSMKEVSVYKSELKDSRLLVQKIIACLFRREYFTMATTSPGEEMWRMQKRWKYQVKLVMIKVLMMNAS